MSRKQLWWAILLVFGFASLIQRAQIAKASARPSQGDATLTFEVDSVSIDQFNLDFVSLALSATVFSPGRAEVRELAVDRLTVNGMTVYAVPFIGRLTIPANQRTPLPVPLVVKIYLRDLESTEPLEKLLVSNRAAVEGSVRLKLNLGFVPQLVLLSRTATVYKQFTTEVPIGISKLVPAPEAAAMLLRLGSPLLGVSRAALVSAREMMSSWRSELWAAAAPGLIHLRTSYVLQDKKGTRLPATFETNGYRVSPTSAIVPLEAVEPWTFDPEIAAALKTKEVSLVQDDFDIEVWMSMEGRSLALRSLKRSSGEVRISRKRSPPRDTVFVLNAAGSPVKVSVARRASVDNVAYLEFKKDKADGFKPSFANGATSRGATFRITNDRTPGLVFLDVVAAAGAEVIDLVDPIDSSALGSPFFARDGLAALVVDERHAIPVGPILKSLRIEVLPTK